MHIYSTTFSSTHTIVVVPLSGRCPSCTVPGRRLLHQPLLIARQPAALQGPQPARSHLLHCFVSPVAFKGKKKQQKKNYVCKNVYFLFSFGKNKQAIADKTRKERLLATELRQRWTEVCDCVQRKRCAPLRASVKTCELACTEPQCIFKLADKLLQISYSLCCKRVQISLSLALSEIFSSLHISICILHPLKMLFKQTVHLESR